MKSKADKYPGAKPYFDRHGKRRWRYRVKGFTAELGTDYASDEFERRYNEALSKCKSHDGAGSQRTVPGSFDDLCVRFYKLHFPGLEESTRKAYRTVIEPLRKKHGRKRVAHLRRRHVLEMKAEMASTPAQANNMLKRLSQLMDLATELEWRIDNPVHKVKRYQTGSQGFHTWDEAEILRYYATHEFGGTAYLALTLILYTGASRADAVTLGRHSIKDGRISYRRRKTRKNPKGILVNIPIHPELARALETVPKGAFTFLQTAQGRARSPSGFGNSMRAWCDKAGLPLCSAHGLRKSICRRLAEAGCTPHEIMSVSGHITLAEAQRYCEEFGRINLSDSAFAKLAARSKAEQKLTNHPKRFVKERGKQLKGKGK